MTAKTVLITGASGSIGSSLAEQYAAHDVHLILQGRNMESLNSLAAKCRGRGATVQIDSIDLRQLDDVFNWIEELSSNQVPDIVIANAGVNTNTGEDHSGEKWGDAHALLETNIISTIALLQKFANKMKTRGSGQLVIISSLAAYYGLPITPSYSASKAALKTYGEAIRGWLRPFNVGVTVVMPGYVSSEMCHAMPGPKPFICKPEKAANIIIRGINKNKVRVSFPFPLNLGCWFLSVLPASLSQAILRWLNYSG